MKIINQYIVMVDYGWTVLYQCEDDSWYLSTIGANNKTYLESIHLSRVQKMLSIYKVKQG